MTERKRLRPAMSAQQLRQVYATPHDHTKWSDHLIRVEMTIQLAKWLAGPRTARAADLSCGDGAILQAVDASERYFGDFAKGYPLQGPIEDTVEQIPPVDLFICSETLEHLNDPDTVLKQIRRRARLLVLSTPIGAWNDTNPEHYWAWSRAGVEDMLAAAGFTPRVFTELDLTPMGKKYYRFGIWGCR